MGDSYEAVQLVKHGDAIGIGSCLHGDARLDAIGLGVRHYDCTSSFCTRGLFSGSW